MHFIRVSGPQGTTTTGKCIIKFKRGAFQAGLPVLPLLFRCSFTPWHGVDPSFTCAPSLPLHALGLCSQLYNVMEVQELPVYVPSKEEVKGESTDALSATLLDALLDALSATLLDALLDALSATLLDALSATLLDALLDALSAPSSMLSLLPSSMLSPLPSSYPQPRMHCRSLVC